MSKKTKIKRPNPFVWMLMIIFLVSVSIFRRKVKITYKTETGEILNKTAYEISINKISDDNVEYEEEILS